MIKVGVTIEFHPEAVKRPIDDNVPVRLMRAGALIEREAKIVLSVGGGHASRHRTGAAGEYYNRARHGYVQASSPGQPPHLQTGALRASVMHVLAGPRRVLVWPAEWYGGIHEFGGRFHPKRPFMRPVLKAVRPQLAGLFVKLFKKKG